MTKFYGQMELAGAEAVSADPTTNLWVGRLIFNTSDAKYKVYNLGTWREIVPQGSDAEAIAGTEANKYMSPANLNAWWLDRRAELAEAQSGVSNEVIMTALRTADYVTATIATQIEAEAGVTNTKLMTPLRTQQFLTAKFVNQAEAEAGLISNKIMHPLGTEQYVTNRLADVAQAQAGTDNTVLVTPLRNTEQQTARIATQAQAQLGTDNFRLLSPLRGTQLVDARIATDAEAVAGASMTKLMTPHGVNIFFASSGSSILNSAFVSAAMYSSGTITVGATTITSSTNVFVDDPTESEAPADIGVLNIDFSAHVAPNPAVPWIAYVDVDWSGGPPTSVISVAARSAFANASSRYVLFTSDGVSSVLSGPRGYTPNSYGETITVPFQGGKNNLVAEADWGTAFGHKGLYYKSNAVTPASAGVVRLGNTENIAWRNAGDTADVLLSVSASDRLTVDTVVVPTISSVDTLTNKTLTSPTITDALLTTPQINDNSADHQYIFAVSELTANRTVTLPLLTANDTFVFANHTQTLVGKTLSGHRIRDNSNSFDYIVSVNTLAADRVITLPLLTSGDTFVFQNHTQTLTNKTITTLRLTDSDLSHNYIIGVGDIAADRTASLPALTGNDTFVFEAHTQTLTNKTLTSPTINNATISSPTVTTLQINDSDSSHQYTVGVGNLTANVNVNLPVLTVPDTFVFANLDQTLTTKTFISPKIRDDDLSHTYNFIGGTLTADRNVILPALTGNDTFVFEAQIQTLTNKTLTSPTITTPTITTLTLPDSNASDNYIIGVGDITGGDKTVSLPAVTANDTFAMVGFAQTLTNKTLTAPVITTLTLPDSDASDNYIIGVGDISGGDKTISLPVVTGNDTFVLLALAQTLTNKTLTAPVINNANYTGGTASASIRFIMPNDTAANLTGLGRVAGALYYANDTLKLLYDNGTNLIALPQISGDLTDIDLTTPPEDGQALVWNGSAFIPGASGDSSFKLQSLSGAGNKDVTIKSGVIIDNSGNEYRLSADLVLDLEALSSTDGDYTLSIDMRATAAATDLNGRNVINLVSGDFAISTLKPTTLATNDFIPIGSVQRSGGSWTNQQTFAFRRHDRNAVVGLTSRVSTPIAEQAVGTKGSSGQVSGGHIYDSDSFPTDGSWWHLRGDANDDSTNTNNLTEVGAQSYDGTDLFGTASVIANLTDDTHGFKATSGVDFQYNGDFTSFIWFRPEGIGTTNISRLITNGPAGNLQFSAVINNNETTMELEASTNGTSMNHKATKLQAGIIENNNWYLGWVRYNSTTNIIEFGINGNVELWLNLGAAIHAPASTRFSFGTSNSDTQGFDGQMEGGGWFQYYFTGQDLAKVMSHRVDLSGTAATIGKENQHYEGEYSNGSQRYPLDNQLVIDKLDTKVYVDFNSLDSTDLVTLELFNKGAAATTVAVQPFSRTYTSTLPTSVAHNQAGVPLIHALQYDDTESAWIDIGFGNIGYVDGTNIYFPVGSPPATAPSTTNPIWIRSAGQVAALAKIPYQEKELSSTQDSDAAILSFNNLTPGRRYRYTFRSMYHVTAAASGNNILFDFRDGGTAFERYEIEIDPVSGQSRRPLFFEVVRTVTGTTLDINTTGLTANSSLPHSPGSNLFIKAKLEDITDSHEATTAWT